jgi:hypothetical protein
VLAGWFPQVRPFERGQFDEVEGGTCGRDLVHLLGLPEETPERVPELEPRFPLRARREDLPRTWVRAELKYSPPVAWYSPDTSLPRALLFHDSFAIGFHHLLAEHFQRMVAVWHDDFHPDLVEREQPDVVIQEMVERKLGSIIPQDLP